MLIVIPRKHLPTVSAIVLIIPCHKMVALRANRANSYHILKMKAVCFLDFGYIRLPFILLLATITQQIIRRNVKCLTDFFQYCNGRRSILADDIAKMPWTDIAELRCRFIREIAEFTDTQECFGKSIRKHFMPLLSQCGVIKGYIQSTSLSMRHTARMSYPVW